MEFRLKWLILIMCWIGYWVLNIEGIISCGWGGEGIGVCGRLSGLQSATMVYIFLFNLINPFLLALLVFVSRKIGAGGSEILFSLSTYKCIVVVGFGWTVFFAAKTSFLTGSLGTSFLILDAVLTILLSVYCLLEVFRLVRQVIKRKSM